MSKALKNFKKKTAKKAKKNAGVPDNVNKAIDRKIERKAEMKCNFDPDLSLDNFPLVNVTAVGGAIEQFATPLYAIFNLGQGVGQGQRIANSIRLKHFLVKYVLSPAVVAPQQATIGPAQLFVDVYIGYRRDYVEIGYPGPPVSFLNAGNTSYTPTTALIDTLSSINTDLYTVLYHRRHKMGIAYPQGNYTFLGMPNNDFDLSIARTVDLCKLKKGGMKNRVVKYNDDVLGTTDAKINALSMWTLTTAANGQTIGNATTGISVYDITVTTEIKYKDG